MIIKIILVPNLFPYFLFLFKHVLLLYLEKLIGGSISRGSLLERVKLFVPARQARYTSLLNIKRQNQLRITAFMDCLSKNYNQFYSDCDLFNCNILTLKKFAIHERLNFTRIVQWCYSFTLFLIFNHF